MRENYFRAVRIIASCTKQEHLKGAKRYTELLLKKYSKRKGEYYETDDETWEMYESLKELLHRKRVMLT